ncbi:MAG: formate dehydrogenase subunit alpha [Methanomassiliicoccales archaeon]|nr:MAG: formate dehydrogenase subunit alpha [Methanomassiliicoccales archaeon]
MKYENVPTICPYCGCGCGIFLQVLDGKLVGVLPSKTHPINQGTLCIKGWNIHHFVNSPDRLKTPLMRKNGNLEPVSWEEALSFVADKLGKIKKESGPDSLAVLASAKCTNEENYVIQKFTRAVLGTNNVDHCARLCHASTVTGLVGSFGSGAMTNSVPEFLDADCILITGSNTLEQHPLIGSWLLDAKEKGTKFIVIDPREIPMVKFADMYLQFRPGSDVAWINGMMRIIIEEGLEDKEFIGERTEGYEELKKVVEKYTPDFVEKVSGISEDQLVQAAKMFASAEKGSIIYSMGITQHTTGTDNVQSIANLAMLTGNVGRRSTGVNPLRGQNNVQGACDVGGLPNVYPGYQVVTVEDNKKKFEEAWGVPLDDKVGLTIVEMLNAAFEGKVKGMFIVGENPMLSDPDINHVKESLQILDLLVVQDIFMTETAELADVILPAASYAEKDGTFTATDRRVQKLRKAIEPIGDARVDWEIICDIAKRMGADGFEFSSASEIMDELASVSPIYGGISFDRLGSNGGLLWPCPDAEHAGTEFLHSGRFTKGRGSFTAIDFIEANELPDDEYPFILSTGRMMFHYHTGTMTRRTPVLVTEVSTGFVEIHPDDAEKLSIADGEMVKVSSRRGEIEIPAQVTDKIRPGMIFIPFHFAECAANILTNPALDPKAKIPELKVCSAKVEKITV